MKNIAAFLTLTSLFIGQSVYAGPKCTTEPKDKWQTETDFQKKLTEEGYKIKKFKVTDGNCYEIYGWNKDGKKVEIYFDPTNSTKIKEKIQ